MFSLQFVVLLGSIGYNKQIISPEHPSSVAFFRAPERGKWRLCQDPARDPSCSSHGNPTAIAGLVEPLHQGVLFGPELPKIQVHVNKIQQDSGGT